MTLEPTSASPHLPAPWRKYGPALWLLLLLAVVAVVRMHLFSIPLERDEGEYAYAGQLILQGEPPYKLVYNMKMPGIYAAYAVIMAIFGQTGEGIHLGFMFINFGAIILMYFVGRRYLDRAGAVAASAIYALLSLSPRVLGFNAHATHFVVLAALGGILVLLRAQESGRRAGFFWSGVLLGVAFLMKQPGGGFAIFGMTLVLWQVWRRPVPEWKTDTIRAALLAVGVATPIVLTGLILWRAGVWEKFWFWTVEYARAHAGAIPLAYAWPRLAVFFKSLHWEWTFWVLAGVGLGLVLLKKGRAEEKFFFLSLLLLSAAAVCPGFYFTNHYFVVALPVVALLSARVFAEAAEWLATRFGAAARTAPWVLFGLVWAGVFWSHLDAFVLWGPLEATARMYPSNDFQVYPVIADYLKSHTPTTATLAVIGSEPELPFYAHRRSVTGYIYMYDLVQPQPFRERMAQEMISEVENGRPDYVVFVNLIYSWLPVPFQQLSPIQDWLMKYTDRLYEPYGVVTFAPNTYVWGPDCLRQVPLGHRFVVIFKRKQPPASAATPGPL